MAADDPEVVWRSFDPKVRNQVRGDWTSIHMLPGLCSFRYIFMWVAGMSAQGKTSDMQGSRRRSTISRLAADACLRCAKWLPWIRFWCIHM